jgi:cytochrome o ubiquinol oxidase subunit 1
MKQRGVAYQRLAPCVDLVLPKNSFVGAFIGGAGLVLGFAIVWHIWWLAVLCLAVIAYAVIVRASDDDTGYVMSASEVKKIEDARFAALAKASRNEMADDPGFAGGPLPESSA